MRYVLTRIGLLAVLFALANIIGSVMWNLADSMPLWWEWNNEPEEKYVV
jgi:hypothetical protein